MSEPTLSNGNIPQILTKQDHSEGLSHRLRQREEELSDAAALMSETKEDLKRLRGQVQETNQVMQNSVVIWVRVCSIGRRECPQEV